MALISQGGGSKKTTTSTKKTTTTTKKTTPTTTTKKTTTSAPKTVNKPTNTSSAYNAATYTPPKVTVPKIEVKPTPQVPSTANNSAVNKANSVMGVAGGGILTPIDTPSLPSNNSGSNALTYDEKIKLLDQMAANSASYTGIGNKIGVQNPGSFGNPSSVSTAQNGGVLNNAGSSINNNFAAVMQDATKVNKGASPSEIKAIQENNKALNQVIAETPGGAQEMLKKGSQGANMYDVINSAIEDYNSQFNKNNDDNNYGGNTGGNTEQSVVESQSFYDDLMSAFLEMNEAARQSAIDAILKNLDAVKGTYKDQIQQTIDEYNKLVNQNEVAKDRARRVVKENQANRGQLDSGMGRQERLNLDIGYDNKTADLNSARQQAVNEIYNLIAQAEAEAASNKASINNQYDNAILQWQIANS